MFIPDDRGQMFGLSRKNTLVIEEISPEEAHKKLQTNPDILLLDVRTVAEYEQAHVEGSLLIPVQELEGQMGQMEPYKTKEIYVICRSGGRSYSAASILKEKGFEQTYNVSGGVMSWHQAGLPLNIKS